MLSRTARGLAVALGAAALVATTLSACSGSGSTGGPVTISYSSDNGVADVAISKAMIAAFEKQNPTIKVKFDLRANGSDGDDLLKTQLATGEADNVVVGFSGSQMQALHPDTSFIDLSKEPWAKDLTKDFKQAASGAKGMYGAPIGTSFAGGIMYNKKVYDKLGLTVPTTWDQFIENSQKIKASGVTPVLQTYGDTWTSQLFVLADFANVSAQQPDWASDYTANKADAKYAKQPGLLGFQHTSEVFQKGFVNADFASLTNANGLKELAAGTVVQYAMITNVLPSIQQATPDQLNDIGFFALPAEKASDTRMTVWEPAALFITKTTKGAELDASKKLVAFLNSKTGCDIQAKALTPAGPFATSACTLPSDVPNLVKDEQKYVDDNKTGLALEFISPIKGPNLEKILIEVGNGTVTAAQGAALYDQDVKAQAQQLGIKGW